MSVKNTKKNVDLNLNPNWTVFETYVHGKDEIAFGDKVKFKYERDEFKFLRHIIHGKLKVEWLDVVGPTGYRSFYIEDLKGKVKPKKFRKKRNVV